MKILLLLLITFNLALFAQEIDSSRAIIINNQVSKFQNLLKTIELHYVDSVDLVKISEAAYKAMLKELDQQSFYWTEEEYKSIVNQQQGVSTYGIGATFLAINDSIFITDIIPNSSADSAGLEIGDIILFVDDKKVSGNGSSNSINVINGDINSKVSLIIKRNSEVGLNEISLNRGSYPISSVKAKLLISNTKIGYLKINTFTQSTYNDVISSINSLKKSGLEKVIIDLRDNPGGLLEEAIRVIGLFTEKDALITKLVGKNSIYNQEYKSKVDPIFKDIPLSILVNKETASSSEIFAGTIQDYDRGIIIGEKTFGKGTVQNAWVFGDSSAFRMTMSKYTTPSGRPVEKTEKSEEINIDTRFMDEEIVKDIKKSMEMFGGSNKVGVFRSEGGRLIIAPGGIIPDKIIEQDTLTLLTRVYLERNYITEYALKYFIENKTEIKKKYKDNYKEFIEKFEISTEMLNEFSNVINKYKVFNQEMYEKDKVFILNYLKAKIAQFVWGDNAYHYGLIYIDKQVIEAIKAIPVTSKID